MSAEIKTAGIHFILHLNLYEDVLSKQDPRGYVATAISAGEIPLLRNLIPWEVIEFVWPKSLRIISVEDE